MDTGSGLGDDRAGRIRTLEISNVVALPYAFKAFIRLGVPKILTSAGPGATLTAADIAASIPGKGGKSADAQHLEIILRVLVAHGVLTEELIGRVENPASLQRRYGATSTLKFLVDVQDADSLIPMVDLLTDSVTVTPLQFIQEAVLDRTAEPFVLAYGKKNFEYMETDKRFLKVLNESMATHAQIFVKLLLDHEHYRGFEGLNSLVDVGGGVGTAMAMILEKHPNLRGINFDLPHVVANGVQAPRLEHVGGSFLESVPKADAVFMKYVLHDWSDEHCVTILKNVERALPPHGKIINVDAVLPEATDASPVTRINLCSSVLMLAVTSGGHERTLSELRRLAAQAGFHKVELSAVVDNLSVLEIFKN
ncbi:hypothetical protein R1flu_012790 [Riccia fluitans]|uniref:Uncharacterized protein n=1 Tax=Riccia fluitans TaxID=41844 RepID=A0ABD1ZBV5_9MARC